MAECRNPVEDTVAAHWAGCDSALALTVKDGEMGQQGQTSRSLVMPFIVLSISACASLAYGAQVDGVPAVLERVACACFEGTELRVDQERSLADPGCTCAYAAGVRKDLQESLAGLSAADLANPTKVALTLEREFVTRSPEYEELMRYDRERYLWFLANVRCVCEGCKATVYFSNCQLQCKPAVVYKRRARLFLAAGVSVDGIIDFYLAEYNASVGPREQIDRSWLLPRRQRTRGWMVPALLILGAIFVLGFLLRRVVRRRAQHEPDMRAATETPLAASPAPSPDVQVTRTERDRVLDDLDDLDQQGHW